eukprot:11173107-Lingulodinium_polyedra.AAC.1
MNTKNDHANAVRATQSQNAAGGNSTAFPPAKLVKTKAVWVYVSGFNARGAKGRQIDGLEPRA